MSTKGNFTTEKADLRVARDMSLPVTNRIAAKWTCSGGLIVVALSALLVARSPNRSWGQSLPPERNVPTDSTATVARGGELARIYCASCHLFPEPSLLDRKTWLDQTLLRMMIRVGLAPQQVDRNPEAELIKAARVIPNPPAISADDYKLITAYYAATAPETALPQDKRAPIEVGLKRFKTAIPRFRSGQAATTMIKFGTADRKIYLGDDETGSLHVLGLGQDQVQTIPLGNIPVQMLDQAGGIYLAMIGSFMPSEKRQAALAFLEKSPDGLKPPRTIFKDLPRTTDIQMADLNGDGKMDLVLTMFGNLTGRLSWFEGKGGDQYDEHILIDKAGPIKIEIQDFNKDGRPDIAVLIAQELESLLIFTNEGNGKFTSKLVFQKHPLYGHTYFETFDFNGDGKLDFLVTNGDNGEYPSPAKKYHGVRVYQNKGDGEFDEVFFYPMNGAFKAVARDFDGDGDLDIAAISFFPDYDKSPEESFVYLENKGNNQFSGATFKEHLAGRWLTMDVADIDGDGDLDILLGSHIHSPIGVSENLMTNWEKAGPPFVLLRNTTK
ncbi:MAG: VCBS repeat-containing protein [Pedosphaera sp.]|nr:VCBS repeat-containing protein [Pedosphaera sp.]